MNSDVFTKLALFQGLDARQTMRLRSLFVPCDVYAHDKIFTQDAPADHMYIVVTGEVVVNFKPYDGPVITISRVHPGGVVGWSAALGSRSYTSSAEAVTYSQLLRVRGSDLRALYIQTPELGEMILDRLASLIAERLRNTHVQVITMLRNGLLASAPAYHQEEYHDRH
jgi:CRP-like cAMP-binding protein